LLAMDNEEGRDFDLVTEWDAPLGVIAAFFLMNDWKWDVRGDLRSPLPDEITQAVDAMIMDLEDGPDGMFLTLGRFKVYKDPEFPDSYEIYVQVGHASPRVPEESK
jgi:hypothetical protein